MSRAHDLAIELGAPIGDRDGTKLVPMLCGRDETGERVLAESGWIYELKLDGVRILADKRGDRVALGYRKMRDATESYPEIADAVTKLAEERVLLDGEVVAFDAEGRPDFQRLGTRIQTRGKGARRAAQTVPVVYVAFDVLAIGDRDVTGLPIESRKAILESVLGALDERARESLRLHPMFSDGKELFRQCRAHRLEGVVAKRTGSTYRPDDRSADWVKVKCELDADLVVIGWTEGEGKRSRLGALDLGAYDGDRLVVRGTVGSGLDEDVIDELVDRLRALEVPRSMATGKLRPKRGTRHFTRPEIVVSVRYLGMSSEGLLRHPVFRGLRHDLAPEDCTVTGAAVEPRRVRTTAPSLVVLSDGTTKGALCTYYEALSPLLLPYLQGRLCSPLQAGGRVGARSKSAGRLWPLPAWTPSWVRTCVVPRGRDEVRGVIVEDVDTLLFLLEAGAGSLLMTPVREAAPATADLVALRISGKGAWLTALRAREIVNATGLAAFAKTAGSSAYDVLVPVGDAPADAAHVLGALFVRLLGPAAVEHGAKVERLEAWVAPWAIVLPIAPGGAAHVSLPVAWDEAEDESSASSRLDPVLGRVLGRVHEDVAPLASFDTMRGMLAVPVDFARAVTAIERMVAAGTASAASAASAVAEFVRDPAAR